MTIESTISAQTMLADGIVREWPFTFRAWEEQVAVIVTDPQGREADVTEQAHITIRQDEPGGVTLYPAQPDLPALAAGWKLTVARNMDFLQHTDLVTGSRYQSEVIEDRFDRLTAQDQELFESLSRAVKLPISDQRTPEDLLADIFDARDGAAASAISAGHEADRSRAEADRAEKARDTTEEYKDEVIQLHSETREWREETETISKTLALEISGAGDAQIARVEEAAENQIVRIVEEGDAQFTAVHNEGQALLEAIQAAGPVPRGAIIMWSGAIANIPTGWALCDGQNDTPDLRNRFIVGAGDGYTVGTTGGASAHVHAITVQAHAIDSNQLTWHQHVAYVVGATNASGGSQRTEVGGNASATSGAGASWGHTHGASADNRDHRPPWYALAYIMKL
ncbi:MAG: hypothetical protein FWG04_04605 [Desulfovibrionaceae bacterium]|nr:hypothetical protein [Desulfovibrionaceae bacterium]